MGQGPGMRKGSHHLGAWSSSMSQSPSWTGPRQRRRVTSTRWWSQKHVTMSPVSRAQVREESYQTVNGPRDMLQCPLWVGSREDTYIPLKLGPPTYHNAFWGQCQGKRVISPWCCNQQYVTIFFAGRILERKKESHQLGAKLSDMSQSPFRTRNCQKRVTSPWWCLQRCVTMPSAGWGKAKELNHLGFGVSNMSQWPLWAGPRSGELHNVGYRCGAQWYITMSPISSAKAGGDSDITWV